MMVSGQFHGNDLNWDYALSSAHQACSARRDSVGRMMMFIFVSSKLVLVKKNEGKRQFDFYHTVYKAIQSNAAISQRKKYLSELVDFQVTGIYNANTHTPTQSERI